VFDSYDEAKQALDEVRGSPNSVSDL